MLASVSRRAAFAPAARTVSNTASNSLATTTHASTLTSSSYSYSLLHRTSTSLLRSSPSSSSSFYYIPHRGLIAGPQSGATPTEKQEDRHKGQRSKRAGVVDIGEGAAVGDDVPNRVEKTSEEKKAARDAKRLRKLESAAAVEAAEAEERRVKKAAEKAASKRAEQRGKSSVIEKEVPLMDLTGIEPGQNKFSKVLPILRDRQFPAELIKDLEQVGDYATASTREILSGRLENLREKYGRKPYDTGSAEVQVAMLTERLKGYDRHMLEHRSDINSRRGFLAIWHRRRKLLKYLRRTRYETYAFMMKELNLNEADIDSVGLSRTSGTQAVRIKRD